ncbi:MAG: hypothetical protein H7338_24400 [Candidatus Sericytochromatia bacterium]|nr:hypothetical protein [Candidatus Sericytochromatia bacterium]
MGDETGMRPSLQVPTVLNEQQRLAIASVGAGLTQLGTLLDATDACRGTTGSGPSPLDAVASALDLLIGGGRLYLQELLGKSMGASVGRMGVSGHAPVSAAFQLLQERQPEQFREFVELELPWALATALADVPAIWAARLLMLVSDDLQDKVVILLGVMAQAADAGGAAAAVDTLLVILRQLPLASAERITAAIDQMVPAVTELLYRQLFQCTDLLQLDDRTIQLLVRELPLSEWALVMKYANPQVREAILRNVTQRVALMLGEEVEMMRPAGLTGAVAAQQKLSAAIGRIRWTHRTSET